MFLRGFLYEKNGTLYCPPNRGPRFTEILSCSRVSPKKKSLFIWEKASPVNRDLGNDEQGSRLTGPTFSHINATLLLSPLNMADFVFDAHASNFCFEFSKWRILTKHFLLDFAMFHYLPSGFSLLYVALSLNFRREIYF